MENRQVTAHEIAYVLDMDSEAKNITVENDGHALTWITNTFAGKHSTQNIFHEDHQIDAVQALHTAITMLCKVRDGGSWDASVYHHRLALMQDALRRAEHDKKPHEIAQDQIRALPVTRYKTTIFVPLPSALWRRIGGPDEGSVLHSGCACDVCKADGTGGYWDTLVIDKNEPQKGYNDFSYTCHHPILHAENIRKEMAYSCE